MTEHIGIGVASPHADGRWISDKVSRIVELIQDYDSNLEVQWIPPDQRDFGDPAFRIMEKTRNGQKVVAFYVKDETEFDERVLGRIYKADLAKHGKFIDDLEANNIAARIAAEKKAREEREEIIDLAFHVLRSPKSRYRHNGEVYE